MRGTLVQRYEAIPILRSHSEAPAEAAPARDGSVPVGPYAVRFPQTLARRASQTALARGWVWVQVGLSLAALITGVTLALAGNAPTTISMACVSFCITGVVLSAFALRAVEVQRNGLAAFGLLLADLIGVSLLLAVLGPQFGMVMLLPGAVLLAALLGGQMLGLFGLLSSFAVYAVSIAVTQSGMVHPITLPSAALAWVNFGLIFAGTCVLAFLVHWLLVQLQGAEANESALHYRVRSLERRIRTRRVTLDADAMALQKQIAQAMQNLRTHSITTGEELAPLAQMINAATLRIPGLLHDRDERLKLERAVRDLIQTLEAAWAGFKPTWPAPSHTIVDRLIPLLRPNPTQVTATLKATTAATESMSESA